MSTYGVTMYVVTDELLAFVPATYEMGEQIRQLLANVWSSDLPRFVVLPPGSTVEDARGPEADPRCDIVRNGDQFLCRRHARYWETGLCPGVR